MAFEQEITSSPAKHNQATGRWSEEGFPLGGWQFLELQKLEESQRLCDMCLRAPVRYAHVFKHEEMPNLLYIGLQCAEVLEQDYYGPEKRERAYRTDLRIESDWHKANWKVSRIGNFYLNVRGFNITIWDKGGAGYGVTVRLQNVFDGSYVKNGKLMYPTLDEAKKGALVALLYARENFRATDRSERRKSKLES